MKNNILIIVGLLGLQLVVAQTTTNEIVIDQQSTNSTITVAQTGENLYASITQVGLTEGTLGDNNSVNITQLAESNTIEVVQKGNNNDGAVKMTSSYSSSILYQEGAFNVSDIYSNGDDNSNSSIFQRGNYNSSKILIDEYSGLPVQMNGMVNQTGNYNSAYLELRPGTVAHSIARQIQIGDNNIVSVVHHAAFVTNSLQHQESMNGIGNFATAEMRGRQLRLEQIQRGDENYAESYQFNYQPTDSFSLITLQSQEGNNNSAVSFQSGERLTVIQEQEGDNNRMEAYQGSSINRGLIDQSQAGDFNTSIAEQNSEYGLIRNSIKHYQNGNSNYIISQQMGEESVAEAEIAQQGDLNRVDTYQFGKYNNSSIDVKQNSVGVELGNTTSAVQNEVDGSINQIQTGGGNNMSATQNYLEYVNIAQTQIGNNNVAMAYQETATGLEVGSLRIMQRQEGDNNTVQATQLGGYENEIEQLQTGNSNAAEAVQSGGFGQNILTQTQEGHCNLMVGIQSGQGNILEMIQIGNLNEAQAMQDGQDNTLRIEQQGNGLQAAISQMGMSSSINVIQSN